MKVTVSNKTDKPLNISKLAPLMPIQVLGVNQEIKVNVKDIENVMNKAVEIGVTVTPIDASLEQIVTDGNPIADTITNPEGKQDITVETDGDDLVITDTINEGFDLSDFIVEEITNEQSEVKVVEEKPKKKRTSKKSVDKKSALNKIIGNNKK